MARLLHEPEARRRAARVPIQLSGPGASAQDASEEDLPGITVSQTYLNIPEGQSRSYTVVLNTRPTEGVRVRVSVSSDQRDAASEFRCCGRSSVWFGPDDWNQPETFTVTAPEDADTDHGTLWVRHWADSDDPDYHAIPIATVTATAVDDDTGLGLGTPRDRTATVGRPLGVTLPTVGGGSGSYRYALTGEGGAARPSWIAFDGTTRRLDVSASAVRRPHPCSVITK